ncbi:alpha-galactosidase [Aquihabitans sp. G128]|uniref:alpha-galactosidase n=1 Tax=Aquihabitans sp. G128 TaxID=2849779 RepID=UPI001C211CFF|nr:alpha-galactosidase [Aquihabitans sp. G128]QXC62359.1 alpha-galactosidase [Aquihabitans sp. G128]
MSGDRDVDVIVIEAGRTGLVLAVGEDGRLHQIAFGAGVAARRPELPVALYPLAYPTFGEEVLREPALRVTQVDGATSTRLVFEGLTRDGHDHGEVVRIDLRDRVAPLLVSLCFRTWPEHDLIEQWVEVANRGEGDLTVHRAAASAPSFSGSDPHLTHWGGGWAAEWQETTERLTPGTKVVASAGGLRSSLHRASLALLAPDGPATETAGQVGACAVQWGGDVRFDAELAAHAQLRLVAGQQFRGAERVLGPGERFTSAAALWTWSDAGIGPTSRSLHDFARQHVVPDGTELRATVVNTWEAVFFDLDPAGLRAQVDRAAELGGELFLLDDGWFGSRYPRNDDTTSLGDWDVDRSKLPDGLQPLIDHTLEQGLRFGLWVEPEMVNPVSELYEAHPDWVIGEPGRERREERNQLVLDLLQPEVRAFVVGVVDRVLTEHTGISYLKWDANRDVTEPGSVALAGDRQSHLAMDRVQAAWDVMAEVRRRHPEVEVMLCSSGGGRSELGTLRWFNELWTSDNTDPVDRVRIQWGASHLLPASVVAAHVTRWGARPFPFGCAVAMSGRFGFDVDLRAVTDEEWAVGRQAVDAYHRVRDLVQQGGPAPAGVAGGVEPGCGGVLGQGREPLGGVPLPPARRCRGGSGPGARSPRPRVRMGGRGPHAGPSGGPDVDAGRRPGGVAGGRPARRHRPLPHAPRSHGRGLASILRRICANRRPSDLPGP